MPHSSAASYLLYSHDMLAKELKGQSGPLCITHLTQSQALQVTQTVLSKTHHRWCLFTFGKARVHQIQLPKTAPFSYIRICFGFRLTTDFWTIYVNMLFLHTHTQNTSFWVWGSQFYIFLVRKCSCDYFPISSQPCPHQATTCWFIYNTQSRQPRSMLPKNVSILDRDSWVSFH